jgi:hypothetical protein
MRFTRVLLAAAAALVAASGASVGPSPAAAQTPASGGATDPAFDWDSWALVHAARLCGAPVPPPR